MHILRTTLLIAGSFVFYSLTAIATLKAQAPPEPQSQPVAEETTFLQAAAKKLNAYATLCFKNEYPRKAREVWLELVSEYDPNDEVAREQLGFVRSGSVWQKKKDFDYKAQDNPNPAVAKNLESRWEALGRELADGHRALAAQLETAGKKERAKYHSDRVLRFQPNDAKAQAAGGLKNFEGIVGTDLQITLLKRSRVMDRAIAKLVETHFKVEPLPADVKQPLLEKGGHPYVGCKSEHFVVYGDWDLSVLTSAAEYAERALAFCNEAFAGYDRWPPKAASTNTFAFFKSRDTWVDVVRKNGAGMDASQLAFIIENTGSNMMGAGKDSIHLGGMEAEAVVYDFTVRVVAQQYSMLRKDAMVEGIGHAIVGMFFGKNLIFTVGQEPKDKAGGTVAGTSSREEQKLLMPDMSTWEELAMELAWQKTSTPAARLPLLRAAQFPTDARIKAWSFCDYLLRRDPSLLLQLDSAGMKSRNEAEVVAAFGEATKLSLNEVEDGWKHFWTDDSPVLRAIKNKVTPLEAASKEAPAWLEQFNKLRKELQNDPKNGAKDVGWSSSMSTDCKMHAEYLKKNKGERGPDKEFTEVAGKEGFTNAGRTFAEMALVWTKDKEPRKALANWLHLPGYRDALLNRNIDTVGLYADGGVMVMDALHGRAPTGKLVLSSFPFVNVNNERYKDPVPASMDVEQLGPDIAALLKQQGKVKKEIGYPLSIHFYGNTDKVTCEVTANGQPVAGALVRADSGHNRRTNAPGMWVFYPFEPLKKGVDIKVVWTHPGGTVSVTFMAQ